MMPPMLADAADAAMHDDACRQRRCRCAAGMPPRFDAAPLFDAALPPLLSSAPAATLISPATCSRRFLSPLRRRLFDATIFVCC